MSYRFVLWSGRWCPGYRKASKAPIPSSKKRKNNKILLTLVLILSERLHSVTSQFDKIRAIRFQDIINKAVPRRKPNQVTKPRSADTPEYNNTELKETTTFEHEPVRAQQQLLDDETRTSVQETETKMVEMSALNHLMSTHVLQQAQQIEFLYEQLLKHEVFLCQDKDWRRTCPPVLKTSRDGLDMPTCFQGVRSLD
ncbi:syntaxin-81-like [Momordica charantia]|uniref:Syntaxin-81-like n=1 Tax=Momordica charantia TaxID=3673 RepID=A0A6J1DLI1_MOMCH|nr:syntaxin-81-like [Momordica charantia]